LRLFGHPRRPFPVFQFSSFPSRGAATTLIRPVASSSKRRLAARLLWQRQPIAARTSAFTFVSITTRPRPPRHSTASPSPFPRELAHSTLALLCILPRYGNNTRSHCNACAPLQPLTTHLRRGYLSTINSTPPPLMPIV
jgi:hypothetical protein